MARCADPTVFANDLPELRPLGTDDARELSRASLAPDFKQFADPLAHAATGSPLIIRSGARMLTEQKIAPAVLAGNHDFKSFVLDKFAEEWTRGLDGPVWPRLLELLAILAPVRAGDPGLREKVTALLGVRPYKFVQMLGELEGCRALRRWGGLVRLDPEMVGDHLLDRACIGSAGVSTGFAEEILNALPVYAPDVLRHIAECEWRAKQNGSRVDLVGPAWDALTERLDKAPPRTAAAGLGELEGAAAFIPERALELAQSLRARAAESDAIRDGAARILRQVAFGLDYLPEACQLLWWMGRNDARALNSHPDHPIRVLQDLAAYGLRKPIGYNAAVLEAAGQWVADPSLGNYRYSPLDVLDKLLVKYGENWESHGFSIGFGYFGLDQQYVGPLRKTAIEDVSSLLKSDRPRVVGRALDSLHEIISDSGPIAGGSAPAVDWRAEQAAGVALLEGFAARCAEPALITKCRHAFRWLARNLRDIDLRGRVSRALAGLTDSPEVRIAHSLCFTFGEADADGAAQYSHARRHAINEATEALFREIPAKDLVGRLERLVNGLDEVGPQPSDFGIFAEIARCKPAVGEEIVRHVARHADCALGDAFRALLDVLRSRPESRRFALAAAEGAAGSASHAAFSLTWGYYTFPWLSEGDPADEKILRLLMASPDPNIKRHAIGAIKEFRNSSAPDAAARAYALGLEAEIGNTPILAEALCEAFDPNTGVPLEGDEPELARRLLGKLEATSDVGLQSFHIGRVLGKIAGEGPEMLVDFFLNRIRRAVGPHAPTGRYDPLPYSLQHVFDGIQPNAKLLAPCLPLLGSQSPFERYLGAKLLAMLDPPFTVVPALIREATAGGASAEFLRVSALLAEAPHDLVFSDPGFCADLLDRSAAASVEAGKAVRGALLASATSGRSAGRRASHRRAMSRFATGPRALRRRWRVGQRRRNSTALSPPAHKTQLTPCSARTRRCCMASPANVDDAVSRLRNALAQKYSACADAKRRGELLSVVNSCADSLTAKNASLAHCQVLIEAISWPDYWRLRAIPELPPPEATVAPQNPSALRFLLDGGFARLDIVGAAPEAQLLIAFEHAVSTVVNMTDVLAVLLNEIWRTALRPNQTNIYSVQKTRAGQLSNRPIASGLRPGDWLDEARSIRARCQHRDPTRILEQVTRLGAPLAGDPPRVRADAFAAQKADDDRRIDYFLGSTASYVRGFSCDSGDAMVATPAFL